MMQRPWLPAIDNVSYKTFVRIDPRSAFLGKIETQ
jgi:hypothetical protein